MSDPANGIDLEIEVKLAIGASRPVIRSVEALGAALAHPRCLEDNILLAVWEERSRRWDAMLRIRQFGETSTVTFKEPVEAPGGFKVRREIETTIPSVELVQGVLEAAGFRRIWRYMKYRTVYAHGSVRVFIDETPMGNYVELEGTRQGIDSLAIRLGRDPRDYITASYWQMYEERCRRRGERPGDLVFAEGPVP